MHGTCCNGGMIAKNSPTEIKDEDILRFGAEVTRGPGMSLLHPEPNLDVESTPIRWLPLWSEKSIHHSLSNYSTLPETFLPLDVKVNCKWVEDG